MRLPALQYYKVARWTEHDRVRDHDGNRRVRGSYSNPGCIEAPNAAAARTKKFRPHRRGSGYSKIAASS